MTIRSTRYAMLLITVLLSNSAVAQAQQQKASPIAAGVNTTKGEFRFTDLLAQARSGKGAGFSLMPVSKAGETAPAFTITPMAAAANLQVIGGGTLGRLTKWAGFTSTNSVIGNSTIFEDKFGMVGIGTDSPTSRLTVQGLIETQLGGVKFPDGTIQTTAGVAPNQVVNSLNGLSGQVTIAAGSNITITPNGNTLTIASSTQDPALSAFQAELAVSFTDGDPNASNQMVVPANKRLVIEYVTVRARSSGFITLCSLRTSVNGTEVHYNIIPLFVGNEFGPNEYRADKMVRIYADGGTNIRLESTRTVPSGVGSVTFAISGYLVDLP